MSYILLLDYENLQPADLSPLQNEATKVFIFVGAKQKKLPTNFAISAQSLGKDVEYVKIVRSGKNALDFHIAFYLGRLAERTPKLRFIVVSNDSGFDPLISHLRGQGLSVRRTASLSETASAGSPKHTSNKHPSYKHPSNKKKLAAIVANLRARGAARPRKRQTLENSIAQLMKSLSAQERRDLIQGLCDQGYLAIENETVTYKQPITQRRKSSAA